MTYNQKRQIELKVKLNSFSINSESFNSKNESISCFFIFFRSLLETEN